MNDKETYEIMSQQKELPIPKVIKGFFFNPISIKVEEVGTVPGQVINCLKHLQTEVDCYMAMDNKNSNTTDEEMVQTAQEILRKITAELPILNQMDETSKLTSIHKIVGKYSLASTIQELTQLRKEFNQVAQQFPEISKKLEQIDLAATWSWHIQKLLQELSV